jgi:hypothetical protein
MGIVTPPTAASQCSSAQLRVYESLWEMSA